jgi:hypothetical protein
METRTRNFASTLRHGQLQALTGPRALQVPRGRLWVTVDGSPEDQVLEAGEQAHFGPGAAVVAYALSAEAAFVVQPLPRPGPTGWRRWAPRGLRLALERAGLRRHAPRTSVLQP